MSTFVLLTITGLGIGALYFLIASGLSLIYGLMGVLNFAHGALVTIGTYASWWIEQQLGIKAVWPAFLLAAFCGILFAGLCAALIEIVLIRPLYRRHIEQVLVTVGLGLALVALIESIWGSTPVSTGSRRASTRRRRSSVRTSRTTPFSRSARRSSSSSGCSPSCASRATA